MASNSDIITFVEWQFHFAGFVISLVHCLALKYENSENLGKFLLIMNTVTFTQSKFIVLNYLQTSHIRNTATRLITNARVYSKRV